jgi:signal transduction histidine kinase
LSSDRTLLTRLNEPDEEVEARMIRALDALLLDPPRQELPAGAMVFRQDDPMDGIYILLSGHVKLYQMMDGKEVVFHSQTAGKILGLLALTRQSKAFFTCCTISPVKLMKISFQDLDNALQQSESLLVAFITVLLRSMARRSTRLVELQTEVLTLNKRLSIERDTLARTLRELQQAQALLVESEKMATLGQMAAGVAHELNNPIAAINRAADFIQKDMLALTADLPDGSVFEEMLNRALAQKPLSTREQRERRRELAQSLGSEDLAEKLVGMGITDEADFRRVGTPLFGTDEEIINLLNRYYQVGGSLRNIARCAERIAELVKSLRSYSRTDDADEKETDLHEGIEDTLRLFSNRLRDVTVERQYGELPTLKAHPGELNQVWTNLIANALDAMKNEGRITIATSLEDGHAVARIIDSGPGIPTENIDKIFNLRFTTRQGRVEFGLGLGLSITQNIVTRHGGRIEVRSQPGRTEFCVYLPLLKSDKVSPTDRSS